MELNGNFAFENDTSLAPIRPPNAQLLCISSNDQLYMGFLCENDAPSSSLKKIGTKSEVLPFSHRILANTAEIIRILEMIPCNP